MQVHNVHQREFRASEAQLGELLDRLGGPDDPLWPTRWPPMRFDRPLGVGADGGHGPIRYSVTGYEPGRRLVCRFKRPTPMDGTHTLEVLPGSSPGTARMRHVITGRLVGIGPVIWPVAIRWLHDAVLEDLLDRAGTAVGDAPTSPAHWSSWVRLCRLLA